MAAEKNTPLSSSEIRRCYCHTPRERTQRPHGNHPGVVRRWDARGKTRRAGVGRNFAHHDTQFVGLLVATVLIVGGLPISPACAGAHWPNLTTNAAAR